ncbi:MAG: RsmE family RNA methyltransferase [Bergeyella zoohelcum]|nr:RsmE family RNA methyltransferase [Bergeyella zoohelcum]
MKLFYGEITDNEVSIHEEEQQHIAKVLRMKEGEEVFITNGKGDLAKGNLIFEGKKIRLSTMEITRDLPKFPSYLHIAIAPTKNIDRIEFFVEKATEMGVSEISFLLTDKSERRNINIDKIRKQAISASKQSLRFHFPVINDLVKLQDFAKSITPETTFVAHCDTAFERTDLKEISITEKLCFLVGPEGDFSPNEIQILAEKGIKAVSLGSQRLRTETAGVFLSALHYGKW